LIAKIRGRRAFARLLGDGTRVHSELLWCTVLPDSLASPPRVAFSVSRACGSAVVRNRVRRRLRALLAASPPPPGWYLFGMRTGVAEPSFLELQFDLGRLLDRASQRTSHHIRAPRG
jgi:ribonuclease P protein component